MEPLVKKAKVKESSETVTLIKYGYKRRRHGKHNSLAIVATALYTSFTSVLSVDVTCTKGCLEIIKLYCIILT